ncbi:MAG: N-acetylneuraminate synthase [Agathobacter sp.]|nr:N-acetylneuraminate synthase [Agathobacter sp.]
MGVIIIAEAGVNHNGSVEIAKEMINEAKKAGVDYIKFQTFVPEKLVSKYAKKAEYQKETTGKENSQLEMLKNLALSYNDFRELKDYCDFLGIGFISTPFDLESIDFLEEMNMDFWKIPSGEITNYPYLKKIAQTGRKIVISTGMCEVHEIEEAINVLKQNGAREITILHCNTEYPTPFEDVNLMAMQNIKNIFKMPVGYSDHTLGIEIPIAAVALGAVVIEKHFTLSQDMEGPDHKASLNPKQLRQMVSSIRNVERGLGDGIKKRTSSEEKNLVAARKSIVAKRNISKGEIFSEENITIKRPGNGISPMRWEELLGKISTRNYIADQLIEEEF